MIDIDYSETFLQEFKKLRKKFKKIDSDLKKLIPELQNNPKYGTSLGNNLFKVRVPNSSIPTGKSGGFRIITYLIVEEKLFLVSIYSKTEKENISDSEIIEATKNLLN
jgi:hypothetical protein